MYGDTLGVAHGLFGSRVSHPRHHTPARTSSVHTYLSHTRTRSPYGMAVFSVCHMILKIKHDMRRRLYTHTLTRVFSPHTTTRNDKSYNVTRGSICGLSNSTYRVSHQRAAMPENSRRTRRRLRGAAADSVLAPLVRRIPWTEVAFALGCNALVYGVAASAKASVW